MKAVSALFGHSIAAVHSIIASRNQIRGYRTAGDRDIIAIFLSPVEGPSTHYLLKMLGRIPEISQGIPTCHGTRSVSSKRGDRGMPRLQS